MFSSTTLGQFSFAKPEKQIREDNYFYTNKMEDLNDGSGDFNGQNFDKTKLIVNYIPQFAVEDDLAQLFTPIGRVESIKIMRDFKTGYSYGFGFVKYFNEEDATKAINMLNGINYRNKRLKVSYSRPPGTDMKDSNLYITNLPKDVTETDVDNLFKDYGEIVQRTVLKDRITGLPRGVAFVRYSKGEEAQNAIANLDGKMMQNAMLPLSVRVAEDHGRQKAQYMDCWNPMLYNRGPVPHQMRSVPPFREMGFRNNVVPRFNGRSNNQNNQNYHNNNMRNNLGSEMFIGIPTKKIRVVNKCPQK